MFGLYDHLVTDIREDIILTIQKLFVVLPIDLLIRIIANLPFRFPKVKQSLHAISSQLIDSCQKGNWNRLRSSFKQEAKKVRIDSI